MSGKTKKTPILFVLIFIILSGCFSPPIRDFGYGHFNDTDNDYWIRFEFGTKLGVQTWKFFHNSGRVDSGYPCEDRRFSVISDPGWMKISIRDPRYGNDEVAGEHVGPIVFTGNWTGLKCEHNYVFRLKSEWVVEAYEADSEWKKVRDLEEVPP